MANIISFVDLVNDIICVLFGGSSEDSEFVVFGKMLEEFRSIRSDMISFPCRIEVNEGFIKIKDQKMSMVMVGIRQEGASWHF